MKSFKKYYDGKNIAYGASTEFCLVKSSKLNEKGQEKLRDFCYSKGKNAQNWDFDATIKEAEKCFAEAGTNTYELGSHETMSKNAETIDFTEDDFFWDKNKILDVFESLADFEEAVCQ